MVDLATILADIWTEHRPEIDARLATIDAEVTRLTAGTLDAGSHAAALEAAHQLAGTAGTFGFAEASEHAAALERSLSGPHDAPGLAELAAALRAALRPAGSSQTGATS